MSWKVLFWLGSEKVSLCRRTRCCRGCPGKGALVIVVVKGTVLAAVVNGAVEVVVRKGVVVVVVVKGVVVAVAVRGAVVAVVVVVKGVVRLRS